MTNNSKKNERRIKRAKNGHRPELKGNWSAQNYASKWTELKSHLVSQLPHTRSKPISKLSSQEFQTHHTVFHHIPCILTDCVLDWPAVHLWTQPDYFSTSPHKRIKLKCGEDDDGFSIKLSLHTFIDYQSKQVDDSPLYIFDSSHSEFIAQDYTVPAPFQEDLFHYVGEKRRPPYRWFLLGPERSGSTIHVDPLQTSAWNALISGSKLWAVFSPNVPKSVVKARGIPTLDDEAIDWFAHLMPHVIQQLKDDHQFYFFVQHPLETVFVPSGWWHVVLNLENTVAVTQNVAFSSNFDQVWKSVRVERKKLARRWKRKLSLHRPDLYQRILDLDEEDKFDLEKLITQHEQKKAKKKFIPVPREE